MNDLESLGFSLCESAGYWKMIYRDAAGRRKFKSLGSMDKITKKVAVQRARDWASKLLITPAVAELTKAPTLAVWKVEYLRLRDSELAETTAVGHEFVFDLLIDAMGADRRIDRITPAAADDWAARLADGDRSPATVARYVRDAKTIMKRAIKRRYLSENPFQELQSTAPAIDKDWYHPADDEISRLLAACPTWAWRNLVALCAYAGLRRHEAMALTKDRVNLEASRLSVVPRINARGVRARTTKQAARDVLIAPELAAVLKASWDQVIDVVAPVPVHNLHRTMVGQLKPDGTVLYYGIMRDAGLEPWSDPFHTLRKWRSTTWKKQYPEFVVDTWLGHGAEVAREHYNRVPDEYYKAR